MITVTALYQTRASSEEQKMNKKKKFKKRIIIIPLISIAVVGLAVAGIMAKRHNDSVVKVIPVYEATGMFSQDYVGKLVVYGNLKKGYVQNLAVDNELSIKNINVEKGDTVNKGDVLITYDTEALQLNVDRIETQIDILSNEIKIAENELTRIKGLIPAENKPAETPLPAPMPVPTPTQPNEIEPEVFEYEKQITEKTVPVSGDGSKETPFMFDVGQDTVVKKEYMQYLAGKKTVETPTNAPATEPTEAPTEVATEESTQAVEKNSKYAIFNVYSEDGMLMYSWLVDGTKITDSDIANWTCSNGVTISEDGSIQVNQGENLFATLVTYNQNNIDVNDEESFEDLYSDYFSSFIGSATDENAVISENYMYTKSELQTMISDQENHIDSLKFDKRQAEIDLSSAQRTLENGDEVAEISGKVTFVASSYEESIKEGGYITIVNDTATTIVCALSENDLPFVAVGTSVLASKDISGAECAGEIIHISNEAISSEADFEMYDVYDDTVSYYEVTIELDEVMDIKENEGVLVSIDTNGEGESLWLENAFVRYDEYGKSYVMVANDNNVIEKRYVEIGQSFYGMSQEVTSGLKGDDRIALPYGKTKEGMPTVDVTYDDLSSGFLF